MAFLNPLALLVVGLIGPLIVLLHLLRRRRTPAPVSSTYLWRQVIRDVTADAPWQRLRRNLLFVLQFLAVILLAVTLAGPFLWSDGSSARHLVIIIDVTASMAARHSSGSRLEQATAAAQTVVEQLPAGARITVIAAGSEVSVPVTATTDRTLVRAALQQLQVDFAADDELSAAVSLAVALAEQESGSEVLILSDGAADFGPVRTTAAGVRFHAVGENVENAAIGAVSLEPSAVGSVLTFQAVHYGSSERLRRITLTVDDQLVDAFDLPLRPGLPQTVSRELRAGVRRVEVAFAERDAFPYDDIGRAAAGSTPSVPIRLVADDNRYLTTLLALLPGVNVGADSGAAALTIFDGSVPAQLPAGNLLFINPPVSSEFFDVIGSSPAPRVRSIRTDSSLLRGVALTDLTIDRSRRLQLPDWADPLILADNGPLLSVGESAGRRIAVVAFDLRESNLPLQVDFPILFSQLVNYLAPLSSAERLTLTSAEQAAAAVPLLRAAESVRRSDGQTAADGRSAPGWYEALLPAGNGGQQAVLYAVNLPIGPESALNVRDNPPLPQSNRADASSGGRSRQDLRLLPALLLLVVILIEWFVFFWDRPRHDSLTQSSQN
jgi:Ca-activated chloride channel family protein